MANSGADTNGCQFFISFKALAHLDGVHVVFGQVDWRDDDETAAVLEKLERVRIDRKNDRPMEQVRIVDCGVIDEGKSARGAGKVSEGGGSKLVGEAKKNKLLQAYGDVTPADEDEIDLDEEDDDTDEKKNEKRDNASSSKVGGGANDEDADQIDIDGDNDEPSADDQHQDNSELATSATGKLSKKAALQKRLAALRTKINQSRTLNRREVHAEATRMGTDEASMQERKRQNKQDRNAKKKEYDTYVVGKLCNAGEGAAESKEDQKKLASLSQPASDSIRQMNARADKKERSTYGPDDYYNPEGQYSNYERNLNSVRQVAPRRGGADDSATLDSYDPTIKNFSTNSASKQSSISEKEGARRLATEMKRRTEKRANQKRKIEFDAEDVTSINDRNKMFNKKIGRNFDKHTAEIRQNLERGTAL